MPFNFLLWNCLVPGATSVSESGVTANLRRESNESVLAFRIDTGGYRKHFGLPDGTKVCDALFFYKTKEPKPVLVFVELKGQDVAQAIRQLGDTIDVFRRKLDNRDAKYLAVVVTRRGVHKQTKRLQKEFSQRGIPLKFSKSGNLRELL